MTDVQPDEELHDPPDHEYEVPLEGEEDDDEGS